MKEKSVMWNHCAEIHSGEIGPSNGLYDFEMTIISAGAKPLERILEEGVRIKDLEADTQIDCLNGKTEYFRAEYIKTTYNKGAGGVALSTPNSNSTRLRNNGS